MDYLSLLVPIAYLFILVFSLATFSSLYRKRKAAQARSFAPYFPPHTQRDIYLSLMALAHSPDDGGGISSSSDGGNKSSTSSSSSSKATKVPDSVLRAALLARATEDIRRIIEIRSRKQALSTLLQRGVVGDEIWQRLLRAEQEMEAEVKDVVQEANAFAPNWGQTIFQSASEMHNNAVLKKKLKTIRDGVDKEKDWWERRRESVKEGFMKELDGEAEKDVANDTTTTTTTAPVAEKVAAKGHSSDEDAVLVETPAQGATTAVEVIAGSGGAGGGKSRKKKGKK